jgi:hypothetical protein
LGSDGAGSAAINVNGGNYNVGGTFLGYIDGSGTFTFNNAAIAADTIKVGVFGSNGTLRIGGGILSANTLLHLYAPGSNGVVDFIANVTLNSTGSVPVIAANTVTIENGVVVTIGGSSPANVFANVPNYSGRDGGNNSTAGTFAGAGATTHPLGGQPPFDSPAARLAAKQIHSVRPTGGTGPSTSLIAHSWDRSSKTLVPVGIAKSALPPPPSFALHLPAIHLHKPHERLTTTIL